MEKVIVSGNVDSSYKIKAIILYGIILLAWLIAPYVIYIDYDEISWLIVFFLIIIAFIITLLYISKCNLVVSEKMVTGKAAFGRMVNLPLDSVSAVGTAMLGTVEVATSSGKISFVGIRNSSEVAKAISDLLIARQEK